MLSTKPMHNLLQCDKLAVLKEMLDAMTVKQMRCIFV